MNAVEVGIGRKKETIATFRRIFFIFSLTNLFNNVPIEIVLEANVKCYAVRWNAIYTRTP